MIELIDPNIKYKESFVKALSEGLGETKASEKSIKLADSDFEEYFKRMNDLTIPAILPDGTKFQRVPQIRLWLVDDTNFLGHISIRPNLNEHLMKRGGHIGYGVAKSERRKGYGTLMLKMTLMTIIKKMELGRVLITCSDKNIGSIKIIETNGGILENKIHIDGLEELQHRYWIEI